MFKEFKNAISKENVLINVDQIVAVYPRVEVEMYELINVTEIETQISRIYVEESYDEVKKSLSK